MKTAIFINLLALIFHIVNLILTMVNGATLLSQMIAWILAIAYSIGFILMIILFDKQEKTIDAIKCVIIKGDADEKDI